MKKLAFGDNGKPTGSSKKLRRACDGPEADPETARMRVSEKVPQIWAKCAGVRE
jgi:hypothetical protein